MNTRTQPWLWLFLLTVLGLVCLAGQRWVGASGADGGGRGTGHRRG